MDEFVGPFRIVREIGRGHNAVVYEAHDTRRDEVVALKVLPVADVDPDTGELSPRNEATLLRFVREAESIRRLQHPNIVRIRDAGADGGRLFIAMERLHGETLRARLDQSGPLPARETAGLGVQIAGALALAHNARIFHRDLKPDNIFLLADGTAKLMDFGAARVLGESSLTQTGNIIGSPAYMAPEQVVGEPSDARTDVWGLGATLFEAATGRKPFAGESVASVMYAIIHRRPDFGHVSPPAFAAVLERALSRKPAGRYASMAELGDALRRVAAGRDPVPAADTGAQRRRPQAGVGATVLLSRWPAQWRRFAAPVCALGGAIGLVAVAILAAGALQSRPRSAAPPLVVEPPDRVSADARRAPLATPPGPPNRNNAVSTAPNGPAGVAVKTVATVATAHGTVRGGPEGPAAALTSGAANGAKSGARTGRNGAFVAPWSPAPRETAIKPASPTTPPRKNPPASPSVVIVEQRRPKPPRRGVARPAAPLPDPPPVPVPAPAPIASATGNEEPAVEPVAPKRTPPVTPPVVPAPAAVPERPQTPPRRPGLRAPRVAPAPQAPVAESETRDAEPTLQPWPSLPARFRNFRGKVVEASLRVDTLGRVSEVRVVRGSGAPEVDDAVTRTLIRWEFNPALENGEEVESWYACEIEMR